VFFGELDRDDLDHPAVQESVFRMATALDGPKHIDAHQLQDPAPSTPKAEARPESPEAAS
jgi:hypothetical protein